MDRDKETTKMLKAALGLLKSYKIRFKLKISDKNWDDKAKYTFILENILTLKWHFIDHKN